MKVEVIVKINGVEVFKQENEYDSTKEKSPIVDASVYARFFDETSSAWTKDSEWNLMFIKQVEDYCNIKLKKVGCLFLNEVYEMLGMSKTKAGQQVGWVYDEDNPIGDNRVDFGIFTEDNKGFINGFENSILLDFNVDGNILDKF